MVDLRLIRHFEAVYRLESFTLAAEELNLSHSAVTKCIKSLEADWGTQLFQRTTRLVTPTRAGIRLYPMAINLLAHSEAVKRETIGGDREIRIAGGAMAFDHVLPRAIPAFHQIRPDLKISATVLSPMLALEELIKRRVHLIIFHASTFASLPHSARLQTISTPTEDFKMVFRPGHPVTKTDLSLDSVLKFPWAFPGFDKHLAASMPDAIQAALIAHDQPRFDIYTPTTCLNLARVTDILALIPESLAKPSIDAGALGGLVVPGVPKYQVAAAYLADSEPDKDIAAFVELLPAMAHRADLR